MSVHAEARKVTTHTLQEMKRAGEPITMLTAYDYYLAKLVDAGGVDIGSGAERRGRQGYP